ncbi:multicopper oxidase domain-containing protein [Clostridium chromiireducens]|uniref:multicopper oxidase domain-containing protein n=1 Tax=Clostridium chromiireducens TaxID=225345 RepID=UPI001FA96AAC|nr:multicopper oxidase domain-containing protein [Clostridium chromiireducens]
MVTTPDIPTLKYTIKNGIKGWGYNGSIPGPTIQVYPGDYVNIRVINHLSEATSIHWHGLNVPNVMYGVPDVEPSPR